jgi:hypothetical protein
VKQVGTASLYGTVSVLLYFALPLYVTHGSEKKEFEDTMEAIRVRANRLQKIDIRNGRIFCSFGAGTETVDLEDANGNVFNHVIKGFGTMRALRMKHMDQTFSSPHAHHRNPAENYMRKVKDSALAMQCLAGLPNSLMEVCWSHATFLHGLTLPRKRHNVEHKNMTPLEAFTGQKPRWKDIDGYVIGMISWGYLFAPQRPQLGHEARHDRWGFYAGREAASWSHLLYDPHTMTLHKYAYISGNPNVLYKDVMGAQNHLRLEMLRAARDMSEADHRNVMAAVDRSEALRKEQSLHGREAMRGGSASEAAEKALLVGRALDESALAMFERLEAVLQKDKARNKSLLEGAHRDQLNGGAAGM